jgi:NAD(P)-dependent dehydrogenase (short-subunit alcohol dehydrogenase family)
MTSSSSVLILGARGRFGLAATRAFAQAGWQVHAQVRPGASGPSIPGVRWLAAQPGDTAALAAAANGAGVVVHALSPAYTHKAWRNQLPGLTQVAIDISRELGATLMLPASVYNFGESMPPLLHENAPHALANARLVSLIGEEPHTPFPLALRAALADLGILDAVQKSAAAQPTLSLTERTSP